MEEIKEFIPTPLQVKFASMYLNVDKKTTQEQIAKQIGVSRRTIYTWLKNTNFRNWLNSKKLELINESLIDILKVAIRKAKTGDYNFCKMILEMAGAYTPGMKLDTGQTELIKIEVVQSQAQAQIKKEGENEDNTDNTAV